MPTEEQHAILADEIPLMSTKTPHADKLMALPLAKHPTLSAFASRLASDRRFTFSQSKDLLRAAAKAAGISKLDAEMALPENSVGVPFAPGASNKTARDEFVEGYTSRFMATQNQTPQSPPVAVSGFVDGVWCEIGKQLEKRI